MGGAGVVLGLAVTAGMAGVSSAAARQDEDVCSRFGEGASAGAVANPALVEISGVAASRQHEGVWWVHNDSGGAPEVSALSPTGEDRGTYAIAGADAVDWEDMAVGPGPDPERSYLYVGDIGDNAAQREQVVVYRVAEPEARPDGGGDVLADAESFTLQYPEGPTDAEALLVDPLTGDLLVISKDLAGGAQVFRAGRDELVGGAELTLERIATIPNPAAGLGVGRDPPAGPVTAADVSPDGSVVLVRYYGGVSAFLRPPGEALGAAFGIPTCRAPQVAEDQGEAIAFGADGASYVTVSEGANPALNRFPITPPLVPAEPNTEPTDPTADAGARAEDTDDGLGLVPVVAGSAVVVVLVGGTFLVVARRRRSPRPPAETPTGGAGPRGP